MLVLSSFLSVSESLSELFPVFTVMVIVVPASTERPAEISCFMTSPMSTLLLDRFLISMEKQGIPTKICINKKDLVTGEELELLISEYKKCGYEVFTTSAEQEEGVEQMSALLKGKTTVVAGPSGVGKSSLTNLVQHGVEMETGAISQKLGRGKHTTRHSQLIQIDEGTYIMDTPGFSSLYVADMEKEELKDYFIEFAPYEGACRFQGCSHTHEPGCAVKEALDKGELSRIRYANYVEFYEELKDKRRY